MPAPQCLLHRIAVEGEPVRGSRFMVTLAPVSSESDAKAILDEVRLEHPNATHHCWAWRLAVPATERASDDGEPGGSAGRPMLAQLVGKEVVDVVAIVVRYFGGTKLGVGGLVRAYGGAVGEALRAAELVPHRILVSVRVQYAHTFDRQVAELAANVPAATIETVFGVDVVRNLSIPEGERSKFEQQLADLTAGQAVVTDI